MTRKSKNPRLKKGVLPAFLAEEIPVNAAEKQVADTIPNFFN